MKTRLNRWWIWTLGVLLSSTLLGQVVFLQPKANSASELEQIGVTIAGRAGEIATLYVNDEEARKDTVRIDGLLDFVSVSLPVGPVHLKVVSTGPGDRTYSAEREIHVIGPPAQIISLQASMTLPADGYSSETLRFEVQDQWGYRIPNLKQATVNLSAGTILTADIDTSSSGTQIQARDGFIDVEIRAPEEAGSGNNLDIRARSYSQSFPVIYTMPMIPFILVGGLDAGFSTQAAGQDATAQPHFNILSNNRLKLGDAAIAGGRAAFYTKGSLKPGLNLTASLDTDRGYMDQLFVDVDPYEQYPLLGDASTVVYDAQTRSRLYTKLQYHDSFALFGDFNTEMRQNEFTAYNRTFNGLLTKGKYRNQELLAFATATDRNMRQEEIRGEGISGFYFLQAGNITRFSEKIRLITRDRHRSETILLSRDLTRFADYDINYVDGTLMFKQAVPGVDASGNPIYIVASYEFNSGSASALIGGLNYKGVFGPGIQLGSTLVTEERGTGNYFLYGVDAAVPLIHGVSLETEAAQSRNPTLSGGDPKVGSAYRVEVKARPLESLDLSSYYRRVDNAFENSSQVGGDLEQGFIKYGLGGSYKTVQYGRFTTDFYRQEGNLPTGETQTNQVFTLDASRQISSTKTLKLGYENAWREKTNAAADSSNRDLSHLIKAQYRVLLLEKITAEFEHIQNLNARDRSKPTTSSMGLTYPLNDNLEVFLKYQFLQGSDVKRQSVLGFKSRVGEGTEIEGKYEIGGISSEERNRATIGLNNRWELREDLILNIAVENVATVDSFEIPTTSHQSMSLAAEYIPDAPLKAMGKYEIRDDQTSLQRTITFGGDMRIFHGLGALAKVDHFENRYKASDAGSVTRTDLQGGIAYRPEEHDRWNALGKLAYISDRNTHTSPSLRQDRLILAAHSYTQIKPMFGIGARIAARILLDEEGDLFKDKTQTYLFSLRGEYALNLQWSTIMDLRMIHLSPLNESVLGLAAEVDYRIRTNMQVGLGYILKNFNDPDFSFLGYQYNNIYLSLHTKFSEDLFNWR